MRGIIQAFPFTLSAILINEAFGFGTINEPVLIGQHCEHERITRVAFACAQGSRGISDGRCFEERSLHQLAGTSEPEGYVGQGSNGAVGAPDMLDPTPEGPEAHCDNADFLDAEAFGLNKTYPRTREQATGQLQTCTNHLRMRFSEGIDAANNIADNHSRIILPHVDITSRDCTFSFPELQLHRFSRSKCSAIEGFGRALHGIQDFYAHSNWADDASPPYGPDNPPGLKRGDYPIFLDLRAENNISEQVPHDLSTGCFGGILTDGPIGKAGHPLEPGSLDCTGRITHHTLNKDNGLIDEVTGATTNPGPNTPRSNYPGNFERAVSAAIRDSRRQWRHFREEIRRTYGTERGNIIICALVRDHPTTDCYGRRIAILRDTSDHGAGNRIAEMQIPIQKWLLSELSGQPHDEGPGEGLTRQNSTKSLGSSNKLHEYPSKQDHNQNHIFKDLPNAISSGLDFTTALTSLLSSSSSSPLPTNKTAIIALATTANLNPKTHLPQIRRALKAGIRVHLGLLPLPDSSPTDSSSTISEPLINAILSTGGTYSTLHHPTQTPSFLSHIISRGLTTYDNADDTSTLLLPGLSISDYVTPECEPRRYSFDAHTLSHVVVSVAPITSRLSLTIRVRHVRKNEVVREMGIGLGGNATFRAELSVEDVPRMDAWFELEVEHVPGDGLVGSGFFEVGIETERVRRGEGGGGGEGGHDEL